MERAYFGFAEHTSSAQLFNCAGANVYTWVFYAAIMANSAKPLLEEFISNHG
jgi:hypothetical protein